MGESHTLLGGLLGLMLTSAVLIAIPGPSVMFFIGQVVAAGRANAVRSVVGNAIGMLLIAVLLAFGLGALILRSDTTLTALRILGAAVLLLIGLRYLFSAKRGAAELQADKAPVKTASPLLSGVIVGFTNPKGLIMFGTIVPSFLRADTLSPVLALLGYSMVPIVLGVLIDLVWVMAADAVSSRNLFSDRSMRFFNLLGGGLIVGMALFLAWEAVG